MCLFSKSAKIFSLCRLCFVRVLTPALPLLSHWQTRISFPGEQWVMALKDPSLGNVIKELEKWNKWKRLLEEHKLPAPRFSLPPDEVHGSSWLNPEGRDVFPQYLQWSMMNWSRVPAALAEESRPGTTELDYQELLAFIWAQQGRSSLQQMTTAFSSMEKKLKVSEKDLV